MGYNQIGLRHYFDGVSIYCKWCHVIHGETTRCRVEEQQQLKGLLQMDCDQKPNDPNPTYSMNKYPGGGAAGSGPLPLGGQCIPTPAYQQSQVRAIQNAKVQVACGSGTDCTQPPNIDRARGYATKSPRPGANEMAIEQTTRINRYVEETIQTELIRAREIGQREGREDCEREVDSQNKLQEKRIVALQQQLLNYANTNVQTPAGHPPDSKQRAWFRAKLAQLYERNATLATDLLDMKNAVKALDERNGGQAKRLEEASMVNIALKAECDSLQTERTSQKHYTQHLERTMNRFKSENERLTRELQQAHDLLSKNVRVVRRVEPLLQRAYVEFLSIVKSEVGPDGILITVT